MNEIKINADLVLAVFQYLETRPAKEVFQLLTALGQTCSPQFQAIQEAEAANAPAPIEEAPVEVIQ